jgi:hypothetical protein
MSKIEEIYSGWKNSYLNDKGKLDDDIMFLAEKRLDVCRVCPLYTKGSDVTEPTSVMKVYPNKYFCDHNKSIVINNLTYEGCGCPIDKKVFSVNSKCPANKW